MNKLYHTYHKMQTKTQKLQKMPQNQMGPFVLKPHTFAKIKMTIHTDGRFYFHLEY